MKSRLKPVVSFSGQETALIVHALRYFSGYARKACEQSGQPVPETVEQAKALHNSIIEGLTKEGHGLIRYAEALQNHEYVTVGELDPFPTLPPSVKGDH